MNAAARHLALAVALCAALAACDQPKKPKVDPAAEKAAATERAKQGPFGADVKALEQAKGLGAELNQKVQDRVDKADQ